MSIQRQLYFLPENLLFEHSVEVVRHLNLASQKSSRRFCLPVGASRAITFTRGLPALAMINDSPCAAWSTSLER
jgi:hypothetical protein